MTTKDGSQRQPRPSSSLEAERRQPVAASPMLKRALLVISNICEVELDSETFRPPMPQGVWKAIRRRGRGCCAQSVPRSAETRNLGLLGGRFP